MLQEVFFYGMRLQFVFSKTQRAALPKTPYVLSGVAGEKLLWWFSSPTSGQLAMTLGKKAQIRNDALCLFLTVASLFCKDTGPDFSIAQTVVVSLEV